MFDARDVYADDFAHTAYVLDIAADEVSIGWCQGDFGAAMEPEGDVCALGAMLRASNYGSDEFNRHAYDEARTQLGRFVNCFVPEWNDKPHRTAGEVADAMRSTAKELRERSANE